MLKNRRRQPAGHSVNPLQPTVGQWLATAEWTTTRWPWALSASLGAPFRHRRVIGILLAEDDKKRVSIK